MTLQRILKTKRLLENPKEDEIEVVVYQSVEYVVRRGTIGWNTRIARSTLRKHDSVST
ncbi:MAG: hypothetical protein QXE66_01765 [Desulfurococcaceae archaeon]